MNRSQIFSNCLTAMQNRNTVQAEAYLADDFTFTGVMNNPVNKREWIALNTALTNAFPDLSYNLEEVKEQGEKVTGKVRITGMHSDELVLPGIPPVSPSHKRVALPQEPVTCYFKGEKIARIDVTPVPKGGIEGLLEQIGAHVDMHA